MLQPRDEFKVMQRVNNIGDQAYSILFEKYIVKNLKGEAKLTEIDSTDQESVIGSKNGGYPIPGFVYTFIYQGPNVIVELQKGNKEYTDFVPLTFCMNQDRGTFSGINLNLLPPEARLQFLDSFFLTFKDFLNNVEKLTENNKEAINKRFVDFMKSGGGQTMIKLFNSKNAANFNFAYRKYSFPKINKFRMVEYSEWKFIPFYEPKNAFRKMNQAQLYKLYDLGAKGIVSISDKP
jgi:hypothetical protein